MFASNVLLSNNDKVFLNAWLESSLNFTRSFKGGKVTIRKINNNEFGTVSFERELAVLHLMSNYENIASIYDYTQNGDFHWIAAKYYEANMMEYFQDETLKSEFEVKSILRQTTFGISHLHANGIG